MATRILMPKLGLTMTEGTITEWVVDAGEKVEKGLLAGRIYPIDDLTRLPVDIRYDCEGLISMCSTSTLKKRGDYICNVANEIDISDYL